MTSVYGEPDRFKREETWHLIRNMATQNSFPWCLIRDMNNVLFQEDERGGKPYHSRLLQGFKEVLIDYDLVDMELWLPVHLGQRWRDRKLYRGAP